MSSEDREPPAERLLKTLGAGSMPSACTAPVTGVADHSDVARRILGHTNMILLWLARTSFLSSKCVWPSPPWLRALGTATSEI